MTRILVALAFFCLLDFRSAQTPSYLTNDWGFIGGQTGQATIGTYGTRNRTVPINVPGSRIYGAAWTDENETFWMYGGYGFAENTTAGNLGDVWTYDTKKLLWTWKSGARSIGEVPALPAIQTTSIDIYPPGRERTTLWHDKENQAVYIFGGQIATDGRYVNDLWKFNYRTLEWTFLGGTYSTIQETALWPSSRFGGASWVDRNNVLWLFGGWGVLPGGGSGMMNDLWSYSSSTWSKVIAANPPPARYSAGSFIDPRDGYMYLFGGTTDSSVYCRDIQRFNQSTSSWENLQTGGCGYSPPSYGTKGEFAPANVPGARVGGAMFYYAGYLWLFGGYGGRGTPTYYTTSLEDVWAFDLNLRQWVWVSGNSTYTMAVETVYTAIGEYTFAPSVGGREGMAVAVSGRNIFGFGGGRQHPLVTYMYGDLWHGRIYRDECNLAVDECNELATCIDQDEGYACQCASGYIGSGLGSSGCQDLDECAIGTHNCNTNAQCTNAFGNYTCACKEGFQGDGYGAEGCTDIDECALNTHSCVGLATCDNLLGSYSCVCPTNYISDGQNGCISSNTPQGYVLQPDGSIIYNPASPEEASNNVIGIAVGVSIGGAVAVAALVLALFLMRKKKQKRGVKIEEAMKSLDSVDDRFNIPYNELVFKRELGAGSFGKVFLGTWRKAEVALKLATLSTWEDFAKEVKLTITMPPHPNVVQVFGISRDGPHPVLILEYCDGGSLDKMLYETTVVLSTEQIVDIVHGIAKGMYHLHKNNIVHRDLAARNNLLSSGRPKISDFGLARVVDGQSRSGQTKSNIGPLRWMAPESLQSSAYSPQSDVWSFGIVVYEIVARSEPHLHEDPMRVGFKIRDEGLVPTIPSDCNVFLKELMLSCWQNDPAQRPSFESICESIKSHQLNAVQ